MLISSSGAASFSIPSSISSARGETHAPSTPWSSGSTDAPADPADAVAANDAGNTAAAAPATGGGTAATELTSAELRVVRELERIDREVRTHEQAHMAAGGQYVTGGPSYEYQIGPDGERYAVGGEVSISASPVSGDPEATIAKARVLLRAALAPAEPSSQDYRVAASARSMEAQAQVELRELKSEEAQAALEEAGLSGEEDESQTTTTDTDGMAVEVPATNAPQPGEDTNTRVPAEEREAGAGPFSLSSQQRLERQFQALFSSPLPASVQVSA